MSAGCYAHETLPKLYKSAGFDFSKMAVILWKPESFIWLKIDEDGELNMEDP